MIPKWLRRRNYRRLLKLIKQRDTKNKPSPICFLIKRYFPWAPPCYYPELYNRKGMPNASCLHPFNNNADRIIFLEEALEMLKD